MSEDAPGRLPPQETVMLAAFEGWNDAGSSASDALRHLVDVWDGEQIGELDPEEYHDFQVNRPTVGPNPDGTRSITWPTTTISRVRTPGGRDIVLVHGIEPSMRWRTYCGELLGIARSLGVRTVVTVGALLADVPHSRPIPVSSSSDDPALRELLHIEPASYEGPIGIVGVFAHAAHLEGMGSLSMWAAVPHYVAHPPSPKATLAILGAVEALIGDPVPLGELPEDALAWQRGVDELAEEDAEIGDYVRQLEEAKDTADLPEASGEAIAREFERYLRRRDSGA